MTALAPTRERLLQAARELIEEGGYGAASVVAIAERAGRRGAAGGDRGRRAARPECRADRRGAGWWLWRSTRRAAVAGSGSQAGARRGRERAADVRAPRCGSFRVSVRVERAGPVLTVLLSRPERRNAVDGATAQALADAFRAFDADDEAAVAVLPG